MLYTIGKIEVYREYMNRDPEAAKGITGSVWLTFEGAKAYRDEKASTFGLYGVEADWDADTKEIGEEFRYLTKSGKLVRVDQETGEPLLNELDQEIEWLREEIEADECLRNTQEWDLVADRYEENVEKLQELLDLKD